MNKLPFTAFALMAVIFLASCGGGDDKGGDDKGKKENNDKGGDDKGKKENNDKGGDDKASKKENKNQGEANYSEDTGIDPEQMSMTGVDGTEVAMGDVEDAMGDVEDAMGDVEDAMDDVVVADRSNNSECDEYLAGYEKFMDNYITILKKQQADPSDMSIMEEYMSIMTESSEWATNEPDCTDMEFLEKLMVIQLKMADAVSGMY